MQPPARFADSTFARYEAQTPGQAAALAEAMAFTEAIRARQHWTRRLRHRVLGDGSRWKGLYLVGPVGTGKTHLLAAMYHALHPEVPCAFLHSSALFRTREHPERFARALARRYRVLCLDEVELDDPANEARLVHVLKALERLGVILLATSNVEPERFLSVTFGGDRFRRFLSEEFRQVYHVVFVGGDDFRRRLAKPGRAWIGPPVDSRAVMRAVYEQDASVKRWMSLDDLLRAATRTEHTRLVADLARLERLYLEGLRIDGADDALRLLRIIDDLYLQPDPPVLFFTAETPPDAWFDAGAQHGQMEKGIAEKFDRTVSRLYALCRIEAVAGAATP